nr:MAG TPA: hypothetical protein [Caudoviricetes sp.]
MPVLNFVLRQFLSNRSALIKMGRIGSGRLIVFMFDSFLAGSLLNT